MEIIIVKYSELFSDHAKEPKEYLQGISRTMLLTACAHFISMIEYKGVDGNYVEFVCNFFSPANRKFADEVIHRLDQIQSTVSQRLTLINTASSLELFEYCFDNIGDENTPTVARLCRVTYLSLRGSATLIQRYFCSIAAGT